MGLTWWLVTGIGWLFGVALPKPRGYHIFTVSEILLWVKKMQVFQVSQAWHRCSKRASIVSDHLPQAGSCSRADIECYYTWKVGHVILTLVHVQEGTGRQSAVVSVGFVCCRKATLIERSLVNCGEQCLVRTWKPPNLSFPLGSCLWAPLAQSEY